MNRSRRRAPFSPSLRDTGWTPGPLSAVRGNQPTLFERPDPARQATTTGAAHPETSRQAAERVMPRTGTQRRRVLAALQGFPDGMTDEELQTRLGLRLQSEIPRRFELVRDGWVKDSGRRRQTSSGAQAIIWEAIP